MLDRGCIVVPGAPGAWYLARSLWWVAAEYERRLMRRVALSAAVIQEVPTIDVLVRLG